MDPLTLKKNVDGIYTRDREWVGWTSAIVEGPSPWRVRPVAELLAERDHLHGDLSSALVGGLWRIDKHVTIDAGARVARQLGVDAIELRAGLTWAFAI